MKPTEHDVAGEIRRLKARIEYLEEQKRFTLDLLESASSLGDFHMASGRLEDPRLILQETEGRVRRLLPVQALAFHLADEHSGDFLQVYVAPSEAGEALAKDVSRFIDKGVFAWALREKRAVFMPGDGGPDTLLLHAVATTSRIRGMLVVRLDPSEGSVYDHSLALLSILLQNCAGALESQELYKWIRTINADLQAKVQDLAASEAELRCHRNRLEEQVASRTLELADVVKQLKNSLHEKEVLIKEVHHRVKNNLQIVSSLLSLQARQVEAEGARDILHEAQLRVRSMALIHENIYRTGDLGAIEIKRYVESLSNEIIRTLTGVVGRIDMHLQLEEALLDMDVAVPCGLILSELISNCLKHAFPGEARGAIRVSFLHLGQQQYHLEVCDDGQGLPQGFDPQISDSLGFQLIANLASQIGGTVQVDSKPGHTCISVDFRAR